MKIDLKDVGCAFCGATIVGTPFLVCSLCDVPVHRDCWATSTSCPAYACGSSDAIDPAYVIYRNQRQLAESSAVATAVPVAALAARDDDDVDARVRRLTKLRDDAHLRVGSHSRRVTGIIASGLFGIACGMYISSPAIIFSAIGAIALGGVYAACAGVDRVQRLEIVNRELLRLEILGVAEPSDR